ncbi:MAG: formylglycine-generating enzyme family protein [Sulfurovum sp.]|nr:formylglycine-generating enzyme family protein [Sulfurovum sp.]
MTKFIEPKMVRIIHQKPEKSMTIEMVHLPKGSFTMGEGSNRKEVYLNYEFEIGKYPVTFDEYDIYCEDEKIDKPSDEGWGRGKRPVINVSWHDAVAFCKWLSKKTNDTYKLPTEKEWEYACRAGTDTKWSFGDDEKALGKYAWYSKNSYDLGKKDKDYGTHRVSEKLPNDWGLFDMHGNVWEWYEDCYNKDEKSKVLRGGSWVDLPIGLARLIVSVGVLLIVVIMWGFVSSELYLSFWAFFTFGIFALEILRSLAETRHFLKYLKFKPISL